MNRTNQLLYVAGGILIIVMFGIILANITARQLGIPLRWALDVISYSLVYLTFMSAAHVLTKDRHIRVDIALVHIKPRARNMINAVTFGMGAVLWLVLAGVSAYIVWESIQLRMVYFGVIGVPRWVLIVIITIGSFLLFVECVRKMWGHVQNFRWKIEVAPVTERDKVSED